MSNVPYYQMTRSQTRLWPHGGEHQRRIAKTIVQRFPQGAAVVEFHGRVIAFVAPNESVRLLAPPFKVVHRNQISNAPQTEACACQDFPCPETQMPWRLRHDKQGQHHPLCEFAKHSHQLYVEAMNQRPDARPDALLRREEELDGKRGNKTGPRTG